MQKYVLLTLLLVLVIGGILAVWILHPGSAPTDSSPMMPEPTPEETPVMPDESISWAMTPEDVKQRIHAILISESERALVYAGPEDSRISYTFETGILTEVTHISREYAAFHEGFSEYQEIRQYLLAKYGTPVENVEEREFYYTLWQHAAAQTQTQLVIEKRPPYQWLVGFSAWNYRVPQERRQQE